MRGALDAFDAQRVELALDIAEDEIAPLRHDVDIITRPVTMRPPTVFSNLAATNKSLAQINKSPDDERLTIEPPIEARDGHFTGSVTRPSTSTSHHLSFQYTQPSGLVTVT